MSGRSLTRTHTHPQLGVHCSLLWKTWCPPSGADLMAISAQQSPNFSITRPPWGSPTETWPMSAGRNTARTPPPAPCSLGNNTWLLSSRMAFLPSPFNLSGCSVDLDGAPDLPLFLSSCLILLSSSSLPGEAPGDILAERDGLWRRLCWFFRGSMSS